MLGRLRMAITASQAKNFVLCPRKVYLDIYGSRERMLPPQEFLLRIAEEGKEFEAKVVSKIRHSKPKCRERDWQCLIPETKKLMEEGHGVIYHGVLSSDGMFGIPDLLEKKKGKSRLGDFYYTVAEIKYGLSAKEKYVAQVMFYAYLLSKVQGFLPPKAYLILGDESRQEIDVSKRLPEFRKSLEAIREIAKGKEIEPSRVSECPNCQWYGLCFEILLKRQDVSLLYKLTKKAKQELQERGINDLNDVMNIDEKKFAKDTELSESQLRKWKAQARAWVEKKPVVVGNIEFPEKKTEIFLDFESEDSTHYLIGVLARDGNEKMRQFVAHKREDEGKHGRNSLISCQSRMTL